MKKLFCLGLGYSAQWLGRQVLEQGWEVSGTLNNKGNIPNATELGFRAYKWNNNTRLSSKALNDLKEAVGLNKGIIADVIVNTERILFENIDTITLYLSPLNQKIFYNYIVNLKPSRVIFNPGTENKEFENILEQNGIKTEVACTLVLLSTNQY